MKIKITAILRGSEFVADPGDILTVDETTGRILIDADVAEEIIDVQESVQVDHIDVQEPVQEKKPIKKRK